jgi:serine/threonine protein kinase
MQKFSFQSITCGPLANESEKLAFERLRVKLQGYAKEGRWIFLTNIPLSFSSEGYSDEIDLLLVSPVGVTVIEVKHWDLAFLKEKSYIVEAEAEKLNSKVKRVVGKLNRYFNVGFIEGRFLLTKTDTKLYNPSTPKKFRGISCYSLLDWKEILGVDKTYEFEEQVVDDICKVLEPKTQISLSGHIRTFAGLTNLELISLKDGHFHRVYKGIHITRRDRVILHLYDLSAEKNSEDRARREYDTIQRLQKSKYLPRILDSFQFASEYPGELCFYSLVDPMIPSLSEKAKDNNWSKEQRFIAAANCALALDTLHKPEDIVDGAIIHRNLTAKNIRIRSDGFPIFTEFHVAKLPDATTISPTTIESIVDINSVAPEIRTGGLGIADSRSDIYALCFSLSDIFQGNTKADTDAINILEQGLADNPEDRISLPELASCFQDIESSYTYLNINDYQPEVENNSASCLEEDSIITFKDSSYKIVNRLGAGGIGKTFKVVHINKDGIQEYEYGLFVAKVIEDKQEAVHALDAYRKARPHISNQPHLAAIHEIARDDDWSPLTFSALMRWVPGIPLSGLIGVVALHAEELGESPYEKLVLGWLEYITDALSSLHRANLVHGDVTPKNIIISGGDVTLIDYDAVIEAGSKPRVDTASYSSPSVQINKIIEPSDDIYALATTFFHVLYDREPYRFGADFDKSRGLNWDGIESEDLPFVKRFLKQATNDNPEQRFHNGMEAYSYLQNLTSPDIKIVNKPFNQSKDEKEGHRQDHVVPRLLDILLSYPGSLKGNRETRGLDTDFAIATYVETALDQILYNEIIGRKVSLVILFGNAGDGKTAFLQHLGMKLGLPSQHSSNRLWDHTLSNGLMIKANLDGSAAYQGQSATELLNEFFEPFHQCNPPENIVHLIAINSGPLLKWIEDYDHDTLLTDQLTAILDGDYSQFDQRFRLLDLNNRSLVGGINLDTKKISTDFVDRLLAKFLGDESLQLWEKCMSCTSAYRCSAFESVSLLRDIEKGPIVKERFYEALQAVHQRGEIHITARELRAAASYIFFGQYYCEDLHENPDLIGGHYYDRAFDPLSPGRQGDLLRELVSLDPALDAHPKIDRYLLGHGESIVAGTEQYPQLQLANSRRRAYFEWEKEAMPRISGDSSLVRLFHGRHLDSFRLLPLMDEIEQNKIMHDLCKGIASLEQLPRLAFESDSVPLKIIPRTPTESALWVKKPLLQFSLKALLPKSHKGFETLHTHLQLTFKYKNGREEHLRMGAELFYILLELKDGMQLSDAASEDIFANLAIFTQRLAQEDSRELYAWNPIEDNMIYYLGIELVNDIQQIICKPQISEEFV